MTVDRPMTPPVDFFYLSKSRLDGPNRTLAPKTQFQIMYSYRSYFLITFKFQMRINRVRTSPPSTIKHKN